MRNMNTKMVRLLHEGFSILTLENLSDDQLNLLYEKTKKVKKEPKEQVVVTSTKYNLGDKNQKDKFLDAAKTVTDKNKINFDPTTDTATVGESELQEKAKSKQQQKIMGLALSVKKGITPKSKVSKKIKDISLEIKKKDLKDFASTKHKGLPNKISKNKELKKLEESIMNLVLKHINPSVTKGDLLHFIKNKK